MKRISYIGLVVGLAVVMLLSIGGVALADPSDNGPVYIDVDGDGDNEWVQYCSQASLDEWQDERTDIEFWHFILNQWDSGPKPSSIHVTWTNGYEADIPLVDDPTGPQSRKVAHYDADGNAQAGQRVTEAYVIVHEFFAGNFVLSNVEPEYPIPELPPVVLLGIGLLGIAVYIGWKRRKAGLEIAHNN